MRNALNLTPILVLLALLAVPFATTALDSRSAYAEEEKGDKDDGTEPGTDLGDKTLDFAAQVNKAIKEGVNWLLARAEYGSMRKYPFAHWGLVKGSKFYGDAKGKQYRHPAGPTALALYTLLKCGVDPKDEIITKGFTWLKRTHKVKERWDGTEAGGRSWNHTQAAGSYELSTMILALTAKYDQYKKTSASKAAKKKKKLRIKDKDDKEWLIDMVEALIKRRGYGGEEDTGWRYNVPPVTLGGGGGNWKRPEQAPLPDGSQDLSSTQLATMALYSAQRFGIKIDTQVWRDILKFTLDQQEKEGPEHERHMPGYIPDRYGKPKEFIDNARGFAYIAKGKKSGHNGATGSMTACGVANLLITREMIAVKKKNRTKFMESGMLKKTDTAIWDGLAWLDMNFSSFNNRRKGGYHVYYLYCLERAMDILGKKLVGKHLWYPEGAKELLKRQKPVEVNIKRKKDGGKKPGTHWNTKSTHEPTDVLDTCFALLFLKRATKGMAPPNVGPVVTGN